MLKPQSGASTQFRLSEDQAESNWAEVTRALEHKDYETLKADELADVALNVSRRLSTELQDFVVDFRRYAPNGDVILLSGMLPEHVFIPATVDAPWSPLAGEAQKAALLVLSVTSLLGEPFNYSSLYNGRLVQSMVPRRTMEYTQTSQSSSGMLDWHCEDSFRDDRCDYAGLLCLRGDSRAASKYSQVKDVALPEDQLSVLRGDRYEVKPDPAHILPEGAPKRIAPILAGPAHTPEIAYDTHHIMPALDDDVEAQEALDALGRELDRNSISHTMSRGDLLIFDNKRVVHARTPFVARFDGTDRWLMRVMISSSALAFRRWGTRIPT